MKKIIFQPIMDDFNYGRTKRRAIVKPKVNGWKHEHHWHIHIFRRGKFGYIINTSTEEVELRKYDYSNACYCYVTYDDFHKFIDIIVEEN